MSLMNQMHINVEDEVWKRFPGACSYCAAVPCRCKTEKNKKRKKISVQDKLHPQTFENFQKMFERIYPAKRRTVEDAGIHLAEEVGELAEAFLAYRGKHTEIDFERIKIESADLFSCIMGVCNSLKINFAQELATMFAENCHVCRKAPCVCKFDFVIDFRS
jgi:NTP pyrophosphatase (non-canonical NTP hydrolase)